MIYNPRQGGTPPLVAANDLGEPITKLFNFVALRGSFPTSWNTNIIQMTVKSRKINFIEKYMTVMLGIIFGKLYDFVVLKYNKIKQKSMGGIERG